MNNFIAATERILQRNEAIKNAKTTQCMKRIEILKKHKSHFLKAAKSLDLECEELIKIDNKEYDYFFVATNSQDDIFKLGVLFALLTNQFKQASLF